MRGYDGLSWQGKPHPIRDAPRVVMLTHTPISRAVLLNIAISGCMVPLHTSGQRSAEPAKVLGRKLVIDKAAPLDLIAEDGTRCQTTRDRFERTRIGSKVWCLWSGDPIRESRTQVVRG
jgi:hypothetical protein